MILHVSTQMLTTRLVTRPWTKRPPAVLSTHWLNTAHLICQYSLCITCKLYHKIDSIQVRYQFQLEIRARKLLLPAQHQTVWKLHTSK